MANFTSQHILQLLVSASCGLGKVALKMGTSQTEGQEVPRSLSPFGKRQDGDEERAVIHTAAEPCEGP